MEQANREAGSQFVYRRQEAGLLLQEIYRDWVLPFLVKQLKHGKSRLTGDLLPDELEMVANAVAHAESARFAKDNILGGTMVTEDQVREVYEQPRKELLSGGHPA